MAGQDDDKTAEPEARCADPEKVGEGSVVDARADDIGEAEDGPDDHTHPDEASEGEPALDELDVGDGGSQAQAAAGYGIAREAPVWCALVS